MKFSGGIVVGLVIGLCVGVFAATGGLSATQQWLDMFTGRYDMLRALAPVPMPTSTPGTDSLPFAVAPFHYRPLPQPQSGWCVGGPGRPTECGGSLAEQSEDDMLDI